MTHPALRGPGFTGTPFKTAARIATRHAPLGAVAAAVALFALAGCSSDEIKRNMGLTREAPDEFEVTTRAPLSMPPDYSLRPPRPGAPRPQEQSANSAAEAALVPESSLASGGGASSAGQSALVSAAGPAAPPDIRRKVEQEASLDQPSQTLTDRLMFWKPTPVPGTVIDPNGEAQRLREDTALGKNIEQGDTPIIQRNAPSKSGWLSNIF